MKKKSTDTEYNTLDNIKGGRFSVVKVALAIVLVIALVLVISVVSFKLQKIEIKNADDALNYLEYKSYWTYFQPEIAAMREQDVPLEVNGKIYYASRFIDDEHSPVKTYTYYVDEKANVYSMNADMKLEKVDIYNQNILPEYREDYRVKHVFDTIDVLLDDGYIDTKAAIDEPKFAASKIIDGKYYYNVAVPYLDRNDIFLIDNYGNVFVENGDKSLTQVEPKYKAQSEESTEAPQE